MSKTARFYSLIADCGWMTHRELATFTGWSRSSIDGCLMRLQRENAIRPVNVGGRRAYAVA